LNFDTNKFPIKGSGVSCSLLALRAPITNKTKIPNPLKEAIVAIAGIIVATMVVAILNNRDTIANPKDCFRWNLTNESLCWSFVLKKEINHPMMVMYETIEAVFWFMIFLNLFKRQIYFS
jgi:hypothetical protein